MRKIPENSSSYRNFLSSHKLEDRLSKGEKVPEDHVKIYLIFRPKTFEIWCEVLGARISVERFLELPWTC